MGALLAETVRTVAGDPPACIGHRHTRLAAQKRDQPVIGVLPWNRTSTRTEEGGEPLASFAIDKQRLRRATLLPARDEFTDQRIDGLGEAGTGLVGRDVEEARGVISGDVR